jgi:LuxR family transcriptional regulator, maltose regulon positive regulatory protein
MPETLLKTKLFIPKARSISISRPRLIERLNQGLETPLTIISAPPGYGKTTLFCDWYWTRNPPYPVAWLSLDNQLNDESRFFHYLCAALKTVHDDLAVSALSLLQSSQRLPGKTILTALINGLSSFTQNFALVLDDYQAITEPSVHEAVSFLVDNLPQYMHLVILSRIDPLLPLSRLRARNQLVEIRSADLGFTPIETAAFFKQAMNLELNDQDIELLGKRTEGWIAGLQLAALSMQGYDRSKISEFIGTLSGSHRYFVDFFMDEILIHQPDRLRDFLLKTSILERLNGPLCDAVTADHDSQRVLEHLDQANLFVIPLDDQRGWYRYHHLFSDLLRNRLRTDQPEIVGVLHRKASAWLLANNQYHEALEHALEEQDHQLAVEIIERAVQSIHSLSGWGELLVWINQLPYDVVQANPKIALSLACGLVLNGQVEHVDNLLNLVDTWINSLPQSEHQQSLHWRGQATALRARLAYLQGAFDQAIRFSKQASEALPEDDFIIRYYLEMDLGLIYLGMGDVRQASRSIEKALLMSQRAGNESAAWEAAGTLAEIKEVMGFLHTAAGTYRRILEKAGNQVDLSVVSAHYHLGNVLYEWFKLADAQHHLEACLAFARRIHIPEGVLLSQLSLVRVKCAQGDQEGASLLLQEVRGAYESFPETVLTPYIKGMIANLSISLGETEITNHWANEYHLPADDDLSQNFYYRTSEYLAWTRLLVITNHLNEARQFIDKLYPIATESELNGCIIAVLAMKALILQRQGNIPGALVVMTEALQRAEPEEFTATFVEFGRPITDLLNRVQCQGSASAYVNRLLSFLSPNLGTRASASDLIEPLSERELEILHLVAAGKSNQEIANELVITEGTVKKHLSNIFGKLEVKSRTQCIARALELNIL